MRKLTKGSRALEARVTRRQIPGPRRSFGAGSHRQFDLAKGEHLNDWPSGGTAMVQGGPDGRLARHFAEPTAGSARGTPSVGRMVEVVPEPSPDPIPSSVHDPMDHGWRRSVRAADLVALNNRQAQLRDVVAGLPCEAAAAELLFSSVRHAVDYLDEDEISDALNTISFKINHRDYKWIDLYASIVAAFKIEQEDEL